MKLISPTFEPTDAGLDNPPTQTRILLIDDDPSYLFLCKRYLKGEDVFNYVVTTASNLKEALAICRLETFECIVVDYRLHDSFGTDIISELRDQLGHKMPSTIVLTADGGVEAAIESVRTGATDFLAKHDVNQESLCRAVRNAVQTGNLRQSLIQRVEELEKANSLLLKRNDEIQRFYHTVSHEVKTPLTAIQEFVSIVHDGLAGEIDEEQKTILNYALESCDQISAHFNDLLELSRFETGKMTVNLTPSSIYGVLDHCVVSSTPSAIAKQIDLIIEHQRDLPYVLIQSNRIIQVLSNLIGNAIKFTDPGGAVTVNVAMVNDASALRISVRDTGCGIQDSHLEKIFDRLYQVSPATNNQNDSGMGLGLCIASEIVSLHGSRIQVQSEPGVGSEFSFELAIDKGSDSTIALSA